MSATRSAIQRPPASMLWFLYVGAGLGCPEIGRIFERDPKTVFSWLRQAGIQTRPRGSDERLWIKSGDKRNLGRKRSADEVRSIREATMRRGGVPYLRHGEHWLRTVPREENPNWKGGITAERQAFYATQEWKAACCAVWARADARCERCSLDSRTVDLKASPFHVHHIVSFAVRELRAEPSNLALLCRPCHLWVHSSANVGGEYLQPEHREAA